MDKVEPAAYVVVYTNNKRCLSFGFNQSGHCVSVPTGTTSYYLGQTEDDIYGAMTSVMKDPDYPTATRITNRGRVRIDPMTTIVSGNVGD